MREPDGNFAVLIKTFIALALAPECEEWGRSGGLTGDFPPGRPYDDFPPYFTHIYGPSPAAVDRRRRAGFTIEFWNHVHDAVGLAPKTTNCCERFRNSL